MQHVTPLWPRTKSQKPTQKTPRVTLPVLGPGDDAALLDSLIRAGCRQRSFEAGWTLIQAGCINPVMYVIVQGKAEVRSKGGHSLATLGRGDIVGEMSMVDDTAACAFVVALEPTTALEVPRETFWAMVEASHVFARRLLVSLSRRLRANNVAVEQSSERSEALLDAAMHDGLTGLRNRRWLDIQLEAWAREREKDSQPLAFGLLDIDHFKSFNDNFGHPAGDVVLAAFGQALQGCLRSSDAVVRYGGEEFAIVLPGAPLRPAVAAIERMRRAVSRLRCKSPDGGELPPITFSAGVVSVERFEPEALVAKADRLLYAAKHQGRNRSCGSNSLEG